MEKRFVGFLLASLLVIVTYSLLIQMIMPPRARDQVARQVDPDKQPGDAPPGPDAAAPEPEEGVAGKAAEKRPAERPEDQPPAPPRQPAPAAESHQRWFALGSADPSSPYRMLVMLTNRGAALVSAALNSPQYVELDDRTAYKSGSGYLGGLVLSDDPRQDGCRVETVGAGTPAAAAVQVSDSGGRSNPGGQRGLRGPVYAPDDQGELVLQTPGDLVTAVDGRPVKKGAELEDLIARTKPGQVIRLTVLRGAADSPRTVSLAVTLGRQPLHVLRPEPPAPPTSTHYTPLPSSCR